MKKKLLKDSNSAITAIRQKAGDVHCRRVSKRTKQKIAKSTEIALEKAKHNEKFCFSSILTAKTLILK